MLNFNAFFSTSRSQVFDAEEGKCLVLTSTLPCGSLLKGKSFGGRMDPENTEQISKTKTGATHSSIQTKTLNFCLQL